MTNWPINLHDDRVGDIEIGSVNVALRGSYVSGQKSVRRYFDRHEEGLVFLRLHYFVNQVILPQQQ